jgi:nicotinate-nucleotide adenylyltransferase
MSEPRRLGLLGGTFDPIHVGHLDAAEAAQRALALDELLFVPSHDPPHRPLDPGATPFHRFALTALAINGRPGWRASDLELLREGPSYTIDTLEALHRAGWGPAQLFFIVGADAFADVASWRAFPSVLDAAHFVVVRRAGTAPEAVAARVPAVGARVRALPAAGEPIGLPTAVYLVDTLTRDVSSTAIRARLAAGLPIDGLVPPAVARHIFAHHLYGAADGVHGEGGRY